MREIRVAAPQFQNRDNDPEFNLGRIRDLTRTAVESGAEIISFHEGCIPGYTWVQPLSYQQLADVAEPVPDGPSVKRLVKIAQEFSTIIMAGLFEIETDGSITTAT